MALAVAAFAVPAASARPTLLGLGLGGGNCGSSGSQVFAAWADSANYFLAPNGGFESGASGWSLSGGASVVSGNEPFLATGSHSLSLPSGSAATTPVLCIGSNEPYVRLFGSDAGGVDGGLHVRVTWYGLLNAVLGVTDFTTYGPGSGWAPLSKLNSGGGGNLLIPLLGSTSARIQFVPLGAGSSWQIDDLYVDPCASRG
ncbi:MAG TPA: hypothetical protein VII51_07920 [Gaiellaceae bacterium]